MEVIFWTIVTLILYHHVGYPVILRVLAAKARRRRSPLVNELSEDLAAKQVLPTVTVIVPVYNEAAVIASKIANLDEVQYPPHALSIVLYLDGCTDETRRIGDEGIAGCTKRSCFQLIDSPVNKGKVAVLNEAIGNASSDLVALTDASALVNKDALIKAASHFADCNVGVVCGTYEIENVGSEGENAYWKHQLQTRIDEAALAGAVGAHGAFYMFRRTLWTPLPADTINDDFVLPMTIVAQGYHAIYDISIVATELEQSPPLEDFRRRVRIGAGNLQQFIRLAKLCHPRFGILSFIFASGKGLRALLPPLACIAGLSSLVLALGGDRFFLYVVGAEFASVLFALAAPLGVLGGSPRWLQRVSYFFQSYLAAATGSFLLLLGLEDRAWRFSLSQRKRCSTSTLAGREHSTPN